MKRHMILQFCPDEFNDAGVPLVSLAYTDQVDSGPYIDCTVLAAYSEAELGLDDPTVEFMDALMSDLQQASNESREAALLMLNRLEAIQFGSIRCLAAERTPSENAGSKQRTEESRNSIAESDRS